MTISWSWCSIDSAGVVESCAGGDSPRAILLYSRVVRFRSSFGMSMTFSLRNLSVSNVSTSTSLGDGVVCRPSPQLGGLKSSHDPRGIPGVWVKLDALLVLGAIFFLLVFFELKTILRYEKVLSELKVVQYDPLF